MGLFEDVGTGIYDFARKNIPGVREVEGAIHGAYDWGMDQLRSFEAYSKIEKELEKNIIRTLYVPAKKRATVRIIQKFDKEAKEIGTNTKKEINFVNNQIDVGRMRHVDFFSGKADYEKSTNIKDIKDEDFNTEGNESDVVDKFL